MTTARLTATGHVQILRPMQGWLVCDHCQGDCYRPCTNNAGANYSTTVVSTIPSAFDHSAASVVAVHVKREVQIHPPVKASSVFPVMLGAGDGPPSPSSAVNPGLSATTFACGTWTCFPFIGVTVNHGSGNVANKASCVNATSAMISNTWVTKTHTCTLCNRTLLTTIPLGVCAWQ